MARTIESPGVEIREIDLSNITTLPIGTNILLQGFAPQGPTEELINVTSIKEFEQIYGEPVSPAERYFYQSAKEVLNSPGRLVTNRLPYGSGTGQGTTVNRSALFFPYVPVVSVREDYTATFTSDVSLTGQDTFELLGSLVSASDVVSYTQQVSADSGSIDVFEVGFVLNDLISTVTFTSGAAWDEETLIQAVSITNTASSATISANQAFDPSLIAINCKLSSSEFNFNFVLNETNQLTLVRETPELVDSVVSTQYVYSSAIDVYQGDITLTQGSSSVENLKGFVLGAPVLIPNLSASQYDDIMDGTFFSSGNAQSRVYKTSDAKDLAEFALNKDTTTDTAALYSAGKNGAGIIVLNSNFTNVESDFSGYYLGVIDNNNISDTEYTKFKHLYTRTGTGDYTKLKETGKTVTLQTPLSGNITTNPGSISEQAEIGPAFSTSYSAQGGAQYKHALEFSLWKVYQDTEATQGNNVVLKSYYGVAPFIGSLVKGFTDKLNNPYGGLSDQSHFVEDSYKSVGAKPWIDIVVNPILKENMAVDKFVRMYTGEVLTNDSVISSDLVYSDSVQVAQNQVTEVFGSADTVDGLFAIGPYSPTSNTSVTKEIGDVVRKAERGLALAENIDLIPLELILDAGLSTINSVVKTNAVQEFNDAVNFDAKGNSAQLNWLSVFNVLNNFCQEIRKDCMCIVDPLRHVFVQNEDTKVLSSKSKTFSQDILTPLRDLVNSCNSSYAAIYANWVKAYDTAGGKFFWAPFSGYQAAIMARMDALLQPWFAPAGLNNGVIRNIVDIAITPNQRERDLLYRFGLNPITSFPRDGFVVYGQKTLQAKPSAFDRINVRRLFLYLEKATRQIAKYFVFEPNTVFTRTRFVNVLTPIFELAKRNQGVYDYLIVCDERNNTPDVIDRNELVVDIYIKPVRTAEFILINFIATRTGANFEEIISGTGA